jgi:hypothetical protein
MYKSILVEQIQRCAYVKLEYNTQLNLIKIVYTISQLKDILQL